MSSRTLSSEMVSQWTVQNVVDWFSESGFGSAKRYIKQHKINGQKLLLSSSQPQKEMFGMNEKQTRELTSKLNNIGIFSNFPSDDSFDETYQSSEDEFADGDTDLTKQDKSYCGYLEPDHYESQTDFSLGECTPNSGPPELPPRTAPLGKMACEDLDPVPREFNSRGSKMRTNEEIVILPAQKQAARLLPLSEESSDDDGSGYEAVDEVKDILKPSPPNPLKSISTQSRNQDPKLLPAKHEPVFSFKPPPNPPLSPTKHVLQFPNLPPKLPPPRKEAAALNEESDGLDYEIGDDSKPPSLPPRPKAPLAPVDPEWQTDVRFPEGAPNLPTDHSPELITPTKYRHPCVPGMPRIEIDVITQKRSQLKSRNKEEVVISETTKFSKLPGPNILKPTKPPKFATGEHVVNECIEGTLASRPPEKLIEDKKAVLPPKNIPIRQTNFIIQTNSNNNNPMPLEDEKWYHRINREEAIRALQAISKNGAFVVRPSSADLNKPYVLVVYVDGEIKNIRIRKRSDSMFALGEGKPNEKAFESISELVNHHFQKKIDVLTKAGIKGVTLVNAHSMNK